MEKHRQPLRTMLLSSKITTFVLWLLKIHHDLSLSNFLTKLKIFKYTLNVTKSMRTDHTIALEVDLGSLNRSVNKSKVQAPQFKYFYICLKIR